MQFRSMFNMGLFKNLSHYLFGMLLIAPHMRADIGADVCAGTKAYCVAHKNARKTPGSLVNVAIAIPSIILDIKYATTDNFTGKKVYSRPVCYLRRAVAKALRQVQQDLRKQGLGLKVWDGYRPYDVQKIFWKLCPDPRYVGDPAKGGVHNRGAAVDVTLVSLSTGKELVMPSQFDDFSEKAHCNYSTMTPEAAKNCKLLEDAMTKRGFKVFKSEWWHYNFIGWQHYPLLNISFENLAKMVQK